MLPSWKPPRYPPIKGVHKSYFRKVDRTNRVKHIEKELYDHGSKICRGEIDANHIRISLQKYTGGIIYKIQDEIVAFSLWTKETITNNILAMKLMVICAKENDLQLGSNMLRDLELECYNQDIERIILSPVSDTVVPFYKKSNYTYNTATTMKKNIPKFTMKRSINIIQRSKNLRKTQKIRKPSSSQIINLYPKLNETNLSNH